MNVLSLFDGMSCGQIALNRLGKHIASYTASEIDKFAIKVTQTKFPNTTQLGDVCNVHVTNYGIKVGDFYSVMRVPDLILAGSPCQGLSKAGKGLGLEDPRSKLFFEFVRILKEAQLCNPDVKFLLENVEMPKSDELTISKILGIHPIKINSTLVSAQNRVRLYWTNICPQYSGLFNDVVCGIPQPKDKGIFLKDILLPEVDEKYFLSEKAMQKIKRRHPNFSPQINPDKTGTLLSDNNNGGTTDKGTTYVSVSVNDNGELRDVDKSSCLDANYHKGIDNHCASTVITHSTQQRLGQGHGGKRPLSKDDGKSYSANTNRSCGSYVEIDRIRRLTPIECCRLQTVDDDYFFNEGSPIVSETQMYKMLGNGWTIDVITHILSYL